MALPLCGRRRFAPTGIFSMIQTTCFESIYVLFSTNFTKRFPLGSQKYLRIYLRRDAGGHHPVISNADDIARWNRRALGVFTITRRRVEKSSTSRRLRSTPITRACIVAIWITSNRIFHDMSEGGGTKLVPFLYQPTCLAPEQIFGPEAFYKHTGPFTVLILHITSRGSL